MDEIKIQNFAREHPKSPFPQYESLTDQKMEEIRHIVKLRTGLPDNTSPLDMVRHLAERAMTVPHVSAEDEDFNLKATLQEANIKPKDKVFVNWHRFDKIDEISLNDLLEHFDDLWYPAVDDIDIFDESLNWILSIGYSGTVRVLNF
jgi:hypothetical protein